MLGLGEVSEFIEVCDQYTFSTKSWNVQQQQVNFGPLKIGNRFSFLINYLVQKLCTEAHKYESTALLLKFS